LLKRESLGLGNKEPCVHKGCSTQTSPYEEDARFEISFLFTNHERCDDGDDGIPEPIGGGGQTNATGANWQWENLANNDPGARAPGRGKEEDEDGNERDLGIDSRDVVGNRVTGLIEMGVIESDGDTNDSDKELADKHTKGAPDKQRAAAKLLNGVEGEWGRAHIDQVEDERDQEGVGNGSSGLQEWCRVVKDEVDTGPMRIVS